MSEEELKAFYDKVAPEYRYRGDRFLRPMIDTARTGPPSPLMTWWLLLYSFSMLARYEPRRWTKLLDLDTSKVAVLLRFALEEAFDAVPQLVLEALDGKPTLLAKPIAFSAQAEYPGRRVLGLAVGLDQSDPRRVIWASG